MTEKELTEYAHALILPAIATTTLNDCVKKVLNKGGCSVLLGELREEYVARDMSSERKNIESAQTFMTVTNQIREYSDNVLVAVDQEIGGICRLHNLVPDFPNREEIANYPIKDFETLSMSIAMAAKTMGVNCFLAPILDVVSGENPWLKGRTWSKDPQTVADISSAFIRGIQNSAVAATAKHFPGYHNIELDPAIAENAVIVETIDTFEAGFIPFKAAIENNVEMIMMGPAIAQAFDHDNPASTSKKIVNLLRNDFGFNGIIMSDGLNAKATQLSRPIEEVAIDALNAGCELLLIPAVNDQLQRIVKAIVQAAKRNQLNPDRLQQAASKVRNLSCKYC